MIEPGFASSHALEVRYLAGSAGELHERTVEASSARLEILTVTAPAVVLGSAQRGVEINVEVAERLGVDVMRRRGGGGAVWVAPHSGLWFDVTIPASDPRWSSDVGEAFAWLGQGLLAWVEHLVDADLHRVERRTGRLVHGPWSDLVCFAGRGPGEVTVDGRKLVGISQRRTRDAARFMCWVPAVWDPRPLVDIVVGPGDVMTAAVELAEAGIGLVDLGVDMASALDTLVG